MRLAVDKNEAFINIWRALVTSKDGSAKIRKFISLMNIRFDMVNISRTLASEFFFRKKQYKFLYQSYGMRMFLHLDLIDIDIAVLFLCILHIKL